MATITASMVNELRARTGQGMMECKKMLTETGGDIEKAIEAFRKKGVKTSITERAATEGRVGAGVSPDHKTAAAVEINCNTDFTAKSDAVEKIVDQAISRLLGGNDVAQDGAIKEQLTNVAQQTGENVQLGRTATLSNPNGRVGSYLYVTAGKGKIAVLVSLTGSAGEEDVRNLGMHIAAARPVARTRDEVPADLVAKEREIAIEQAKQTGKPQQIAEKIADGKMNAFYAERVLLDQDFINPEAFKGKISEYLKQKNLTLEQYVRIEVGQA